MTNSTTIHFAINKNPYSLNAVTTAYGMKIKTMHIKNIAKNCILLQLLYNLLYYIIILKSTQILTKFKVLQIFF